MPVRWRPAHYFAQVAALEEAGGPSTNWSDDDPRARERLTRIIELGADAPPVRTLHGRLVRLPGYVLPLEAGAGAHTNFLLVPYQGACVHSPPPPANQAVWVQAEPPLPAARVPHPLWVEGRLTLQPRRTRHMAVAYRVDATALGPFDETADRDFLPRYVVF